jgi:hypothetical protein
VLGSEAVAAVLASAPTAAALPGGDSGAGDGTGWARGVLVVMPSVARKATPGTARFMWPA